LRALFKEGLMPKREITLESFGAGVLKELFDAEFKKILKNIGDPNTKPDAVRKLKIEISIKPSKDRTSAVVETQSFSKLANTKGFNSSMFFGTDDGKKVKAFEYEEEKQEMLPGVLEGTFGGEDD
jgi:hypothetical protein